MKKKFYFLMSAALLSLSVSACGGTDSSAEAASSATETSADADGNTSADANKGTSDTSKSTSNASAEEASETVDEEMAEPIDPTGTYHSLSLLQPNSVYELHENGTYDRTSPEEKGTYTVSDSGTISFTQKDYIVSDTYAPYENYYFCTSDSIFTGDKDYGAAPSFDENGRSSQSFETSFGLADETGTSRAYILTFKEDGTFSLQEEIGQMQGQFLAVQDGDLKEGNYTLDGEIITLSWNGADYKLLFRDNRIFYDVIVKETDENTNAISAGNDALQAAEDAKYAPVDDALASEIKEKLQSHGQWEYSAPAGNTTATYYVDFNGDSFKIKCVLAGYQISNQGTYIVCKDLLLITYDNGEKSTMNYDYENGTITIYPLVAISE